MNSVAPSGSANPALTPLNISKVNRSARIFAITRRVLSLDHLKLTGQLDALVAGFGNDLETAIQLSCFSSVHSITEKRAPC